MEWSVVESLACPVTATFLSCIISNNNSWLIIWSSQGQNISQGEVIEINSEGVYLCETGEEIEVIKAGKFQASLWKVLQETTRCPGNGKVKPQQCNYHKKCRFRNCPYGIKKFFSGMDEYSD